MNSSLDTLGLRSMSDSQVETSLELPQRDSYDILPAVTYTWAEFANHRSLTDMGLRSKILLSLLKDEICPSPLSGFYYSPEPGGKNGVTGGLGYSTSYPMN